MALYFLQFSAAYREASDPAIFRRRAVVAAHLKDNYKAGRNRDDEVFQAVKTELEKEGIAIERQEYINEKNALRSLYLWLNADSDEERAKSGATMIITGHLERDGITSWDKVLELAGIKGETAQARPTPTEVRVRLRDSQAGQEVADLLGELMPHLEAMLEENEHLKQAALQASEEATPLRQQLDDANALIELLEADSVSLEERLAATRESLRRAHSATIEEIAAEHPEIPQLTTIAQQLKSGSGRRQEELKKMLGRLPKEFNWGNDRGGITYQEPFRKALVGLEPSEQEQVIRQLEAFATQGAEYTSLHTRKNEMRLPFSPAGCFTSRGADDLRFTWKKNGDVVIYWLYRKGDSRVRQSEA